MSIPVWLGGAVNICGKAVAGPQKKSVTRKIEHFCSREAAYCKQKILENGRKSWKRKRKKKIGWF